MNKKHFIPTVACISLCSLTFSNCATVANYRKDPSEWNLPGTTPSKENKKTPKVKANKEKKVKVAKVKKEKKKRGGFFGTIAKYRQDPKHWNLKGSQAAEVETPKPKVKEKVIAKAKAKTKSTPRVYKPKPTYKKPTYVKEQVKTSTLLPLNPTSKTQQGRRKVGQLLTPNSDRLPTQKDLIEVQPTLPKNENSNGVRIPIQP